MSTFSTIHTGTGITSITQLSFLIIYFQARITSSTKEAPLNSHLRRDTKESLVKFERRLLRRHRKFITFKAHASTSRNYFVAATCIDSSEPYLDHGWVSASQLSNCSCTGPISACLCHECPGGILLLRPHNMLFSSSIELAETWAGSSRSGC